MKTAMLKVDSQTPMKINGAGEQIDGMGDEVYGVTEEERGIMKGI